MWWKSAVNFSFLLSLATCRMRSSACDALARLCVRCVLLLVRIPLGPRPSLHRLRCFRLRCSWLRNGLFGFVRRLRCYYGGGRLLGAVHHPLLLLALPVRGIVHGTPSTTTG